MPRRTPCNGQPRPAENLVCTLPGVSETGDPVDRLKTLRQNTSQASRSYENRLLDLRHGHPFRAR